jgi:hypothetical protein
MVRSAERGQIQTAYQVLVASAPEILARDHGDLWDSGRVASGATTGVPYAGVPLRSLQPVCWKVRAWDRNGTPSPWSTPATWTMGRLGPADWQAAWITDADLLRRRRAFLGYRSADAADPDTIKWVQLDLGARRRVDEVRLDGLRFGAVEGLGFPRRFKVELSDDPQFQTALSIADQTREDFPNRSTVRLSLPAHGAQGRYLRLTATRLRVEGGLACLAVSRIEVISGGEAVDPGAAVTASDSVEQAPWSAAALADGLGGPGANPRANTTLLLRREFTVKPGLRRALASVCGLGGYTFALNGARIGDGVLSPGWTDSGKTCLYDSYDVTGRLQPGANAVGLCVAGGMYDVEDGRYSKFVTPVRPLTAIAEIRLEYADGSVETVGTDDRWRVAQGPITFANVYGGEDYDARREPRGWAAAGFNDSSWRPGATWKGPGGALRGLSAAAPPIRADGDFPPVKATPIRPGVAVYDLGQNAAMMLKLSVRGPAGSVVRVIPAELLAPDGSVDARSGGVGSWWTYTLAGAGEETWAPEFFYHGCRYLQVERLPASGAAGLDLPEVLSIAGSFVHSSAPPAGQFACSNDLFNRIHSLVRWAQQSNMMSILTDCPHRERLGWLEQDHLNGPALRYEFGLDRLFGKIASDMADAQLADGMVPDIAPEYVRFSGGFRDSPEWGSACVLVPWQQYEWTGDVEVLRRTSEMMRRYVDYLGSRATGRILSYGLGDWYDLGPKPPGVAQLTPVALTATAFYCQDARIYARVAALLGRPEEAGRYARLADEIQAAFNRKFFDPQTGRYARGSQCGEAVALAMDLAEPALRAGVLAALVQDLADHGGASTAGDVGYRFLLRALADGGRSDLVAAMINRSDRPGYGYQLARGATSLTEAWDASPRASQDHFMLGQINEWFYHDLAGIQGDPAGAGFSRIIIRPAIVGEVTWVRARYESIRGPIACSWRRDEAGLTLEATIPANTAATIYVPAATEDSVREGGRPAVAAAGVRFLRMEGACALFSVGSGTYSFTSRMPAGSGF